MNVHIYLGVTTRETAGSCAIDSGLHCLFRPPAYSRKWATRESRRSRKRWQTRRSKSGLSIANA